MSPTTAIVLLSVLFLVADCYVITQFDVDWNLARISHEKLDGDFYVYKYPSTSTEDVSVYILDSGINGDHEEFEGRVQFLGSFVDGDPSDGDPSGHGTAIASVVGGASSGIAKEVRMYSIKIADHRGYSNYRYVGLT